MENMFYNFGLIYLLNCIYDLYINKVISFNTSNTIDDVIKSKEEEDSKPFTIITIVTQLISVIGFYWFYLGIRLSDFIFFKIGFFTILFYYIFIIIIGVIIGFNGVHQSPVKVYNVPEEKPVKTIPLMLIVDVVKITCIVSILINYYLL